MPYTKFVRKINDISIKSGVPVTCFNDKVAGKYIAEFEDGTTIVGCKSSIRVTVTFWSGHQALTTI